METNAHMEQESGLCFYFTIVGHSALFPKLLILGIPLSFPLSYFSLMWYVYMYAYKHVSISVCICEWGVYVCII